MNAMNQIIIEGNVVRDSVIKETPKGTKVATMPIASNRVYKDINGDFQQEVSFFDVETWGSNFCERVAKNAVKGRGVRVVGRLKQNRWKDDSGKSFSKVYIIADHIDFKPAAKESQRQSSSSRPELENLAETKAGIQSEMESEYEREAVAETVF